MTEKATEEFGVPLSLEQAIEEIDLLLAYAAQKGLEIDKDSLNAVVHAKEQAKRGAPLDRDAESAFWSAYRQIAQIIKPATVGSIKAGSDRFGARVWTLRGRRVLSKARQAVRRYQIISVFSLITLLIVQLYAGMGATILNDLRQLEQRKIDKQQDLKILGIKNTRALNELVALAQKPQDDGQPPPEEPCVAGVDAMTLRLCEEISRTAAKLDDTDQDIEFLIVDLQAKYRLLEFWNLWWVFWEKSDAATVSDQEQEQVSAAPTPDTGEQDEVAGEAPDAASAAAPGADEPAGEGGFASVEETDGRKPETRDETTDRGFARDDVAQDAELANILAKSGPRIKPVPEPKFPVQAPGRSRSSSAAADEYRKFRQHIVLAGLITLKALNVYFLPLVYGLLGACAYVLRRLSTEIREYTYSPESDIRLQLRLYLGALSGFAVAWFLNESTAPGLTGSIAPLALAFLAGYSVEVVFAAMDNLVEAFSRPRDDTKGV